MSKVIESLEILYRLYQIRVSIRLAITLAGVQIALITQSEGSSIDANHGSDTLIFSIHIFVLRQFWYNLRYEPSCT